MQNYRCIVSCCDIKHVDIVYILLYILLTRNIELHNLIAQNITHHMMCYLSHRPIFVATYKFRGQSAILTLPLLCSVGLVYPVLNYVIIQWSVLYCSLCV